LVPMYPTIPHMIGKDKGLKNEKAPAR
jgi:hypothetical protein